MEMFFNEMELFIPREIYSDVTAKLPFRAHCSSNVTVKTLAKSDLPGEIVEFTCF